MKVLFITRLYLPHIGGVEKHIAGLVRHSPKNIQITVLTEAYSSDLPVTHETDSVIRIRTYKYSQRQKKFAIWKWIIKNRNFVNSFDIIHIHDTVFWIYPIWPLIKNKVFCTFHGWEGKYPLPAKNILQKKFDSKLVKNSIAVGEFIARWYGIKASVTTYGATEQAKYVPVQLPKNSLLFLGRLDPDTGFEDCLNFLNQNSHINLAVIGSGSLHLPDNKRIKYLGVVSDPTAYIHAAEWVYTTGYMGILESFLAKKQVYVSASNPLKLDYLQLHPMSEFLHFDKDLQKKFETKTPYNWAVNQNYPNLWKVYQQLWLKKT